MYTQKRPIENTHIIRERDRRRFRELLAVLSVAVPFALFLLLFTWQNLEVIRLGRESTNLQRQRERLENLNRDLRLEIERLTALDAVEQKAVTLGFTRTVPSQIVKVVPAEVPDNRLQVKR